MVKSAGTSQDGGQSCHWTACKLELSSSWHTILSIPRGPKLVLTASATAFAASMLVMRTSFFLEFWLQQQGAAGCIGRSSRPLGSSKITGHMCLELLVAQHSLNSFDLILPGLPSSQTSCQACTLGHADSWRTCRCLPSPSSGPKLRPPSAPLSRWAIDGMLQFRPGGGGRGGSDGRAESSAGQGRRF